MCAAGARAGLRHFRQGIRARGSGRMRSGHIGRVTFHIPRAAMIFFSFCAKSYSTEIKVVHESPSVHLPISRSAKNSRNEHVSLTESQLPQVHASCFG
jgi:hypothetical protein